MCDVGDGKLWFVVKQLLGIVDAQEGDIGCCIISGDAAYFAGELSRSNSQLVGERCSIEFVLPYEGEDVVVEAVEELLLLGGGLRGVG